MKRGLGNLTWVKLGNLTTKQNAMLIVNAILLYFYQSINSG